MVEKDSLLKIFTVNDEYIKDLRDNLSSHVFSNQNPNYNHSRKYIGVLLFFNGFAYYAPLSSPKSSDYIWVKGEQRIRKSIPPIIRMVETDENGKKTLLGTIKLSNMIPVPEDMIALYDLDNEPDKAYKDLVMKEKRYINRNEEMILFYASTLYKEKTEGNSEKGYLNSTLDFTEFENYITENWK